MKLTRTHSKSPDEVREAVEHIAEKLSEAWGISYHWEENELKFNRTGVSGYILIRNGEVEVDVKKSFFLPISESMIEAKVTEYFDRYLG